MSKGVIKKVAGPLVIASGMRDANMFDVVRVSKQRLIGEIIEMHGDEASIQVYEETSGLGPGEPVESMEVPMSVELGPGLITSIYDGIQRPLDDIMKISDEETKLLTDKESPEEATEILFRKGVKIVAVTLGSDGAYLYCKEGGVHIPGFVSKAVDTNGAGDSFWGGFLYCISKAGKRPEAFTMDELKEYVRFGNAVASLCVERKGAIPAMPELAQVEERMGR